MNPPQIRGFEEHFEGSGSAKNKLKFWISKREKTARPGL